jgi:hypothetical protein
VLSLRVISGNIWLGYGESHLVLYIHLFRALLCLSKKLRAPRGPEVRMLRIIRARRVFCSPVPHLPSYTSSS